MRGLGFRLYLIFVISWFLHVPTRVQALGVIRADLLLIVLISMCVFLTPKEPGTRTVSTNKWIRLIFIYVVVTLPLVEWPGSVIKDGIPNYIKAVVFYFFTIALIDTEKRLKTFMTVFLACQAIRVIEPVVLHVTTGYWGSQASMANWEKMQRLAGAPSDIVNPNGLAFICLMVLPFLHYLTGVSWKNKVLYVIIAPVLLYALFLTASRTGFVCLLVLMAGFWMKSRRKMGLTVAFGIVGIIALASMSGNLKDRYLSLFSSSTKNAGTVEGRVDALKENFAIALRKPLFGHGLGTSVEANANYGSYGKIAHNLYAEIAQEMGLFGLILFGFFVRSIIQNFRESLQDLKRSRNGGVFLSALTNGMQVWIFMNIIFSFASYGFSSYEWYLFGGLSIVLRRIVVKKSEQAVENAEPAPAPIARFRTSFG